MKYTCTRTIINIGSIIRLKKESLNIKSSVYYNGFRVPAFWVHRFFHCLHAASRKLSLNACCIKNKNMNNDVTAALCIIKNIKSGFNIRGCTLTHEFGNSVLIEGFFFDLLLLYKRDFFCSSLVNSVSRRFLAYASAVLPRTLNRGFPLCCSDLENHLH